VVALTDASGNAVNRYVYDPYGNHLAGTVEGVGNPWQFASGFKDTFNGYYKFGTRYYDPKAGRWTQRDPASEDANAYIYVGQNPLNFVDPSGLNICRSQRCVNRWIKEHGTINAVTCVIACVNVSERWSWGALQFSRSGRFRAGSGIAVYGTLGTRKPGRNLSLLVCGIKGVGCLGGYWNWDDHGWGAMAGAGTPGVFVGPSFPIDP
jgi:RHS repeat-associated protein